MKKLLVLLVSILIMLTMLTSCFEKDEDTPAPTQPTTTPPVDSVQLFFDWLKGKKWECDSVNMTVNTDESFNSIFRNPKPLFTNIYSDTLYTFTVAQPSGFTTSTTFQINYSTKTVNMRGSSYELLKLSETRMNLRSLYTSDVYKFKLVGNY